MPVKIIFLHIPQNGGELVKKFFRKTGDRHNMAWLGEDFKREQLINPPPDFLCSYSVIGGHFPLLQAKRIPGDHILVSLIRDPVERIPALYNFIRSNAYHPLYHLARELTLVELINCSENFRKQVSDYQVKCLSVSHPENPGIPDFKSTIADLESSPFCLAATHKISTFCRELAGLLHPGQALETYGIKIPNSLKTTTAAPLSPEITKYLRELNPTDTKLYSWLESQGGIIRPHPSLNKNTIPSFSGLPTTAGKPLITSQKIVFLHIPKTGGTTLHNLLKPHFSKDRICPERLTLSSMEDPALDHYLLFSGHFDWQVAERLPEPNRTLSLVRHPKKRILSLYHFWRSHTWDHINEKNLKGPRLAKSKSLEDFLRLKDHGIPGNIDNTLTRTFLGRMFCGPDGEYLFPEDEVVERALANLWKLDEIGIIEFARPSISRILGLFDIEMPEITPRDLDSRDFHSQKKMETVEQQPVTSRAEEALERLTCRDCEIYTEILDKYYPIPNKTLTINFRKDRGQFDKYLEDKWIIKPGIGIFPNGEALLTLRLPVASKKLSFDFSLSSANGLESPGIEVTRLSSRSARQPDSHGSVVFGIQVEDPSLRYNFGVEKFLVRFRKGGKVGVLKEIRLR